MAGISPSSEGKIVFAGVWENDRIWAQWIDHEHGIDVDSLKQLSVSLFQRIDRSYDHQKPFAPYQGFVFQYLVEDERAFLAACTEGIQQRVMYGYLQKIKQEYFERFVNTQKKAAFEKLMREQAAEYSESLEMDRLRSLKKKVDEVIVDMTTNYALLDTRGKELEQLQDSAKLLEESSQQLYGDAKKLRCKLCRDNLKATIAVSGTCVCLIVVVVFIILFFFVWNKPGQPYSFPTEKTSSTAAFNSTKTTRPPTTTHPTTTRSTTTRSTSTRSTTTTTFLQSTHT